MPYDVQGRRPAGQLYRAYDGGKVLVSTRSILKAMALDRRLLQVNKRIR
jgi:hypothetical protein